MKDKTYSVEWEEQRVVTVRAKTREEAQNMVMAGDFDEREVQSREFTVMPTAYEEK